MRELKDLLCEAREKLENVRLTEEECKEIVEKYGQDKEKKVDFINNQGKRIKVTYKFKEILFNPPIKGLNCAILAMRIWECNPDYLSLVVRSCGGASEQVILNGIELRTNNTCSLEEFEKCKYNYFSAKQKKEFYKAVLSFKK